MYSIPTQGTPGTKGYGSVGDRTWRLPKGVDVKQGEDFVAGFHKLKGGKLK
tara:strand:+ start:569 stop:721 length:153 start_codon:yes stop_codon:yes gene_type:complete